MSSPTRAEREDRIERDTGDPDTTVYHSSWRSEPGVYHTNPDCTRIKRPDRIRDCTRRKAHAMIKPPCLYCVLGETSRGGVRGETCPYCGAGSDPDEDGIHLATHLPCDGAAKDTVEAIVDD